MDYFSLCLNGLCLGGQSVLHIAFLSRFAGKRLRIWHFAAYLFLLCGMEWFFTRLAIHDILAISMELLVLYGMSHFAMGNQPAMSWAASIFAIYISQLSFGIVNSAEAVIFPLAVGKLLLYLLVILATLAAFAICACCYAAVLKCLPLTEKRQLPYIGVLLFPELFSFAAELYILRTAYSVLPYAHPLENVGTHSALMFLQVLGLAALFCTLYAYRHLCRSLQAQAQKAYFTEVQARYEQTKAFRHDIANHLSILDGLLDTGRWEESRAYLQKLKTASAALSLPCQTGNPIVDILLGEKLGLARKNGIAAEVSLLLPGSCGIDNFDLCIIFANALDNAVCACQAIEGVKSIRIRGERQGDFYMLAFENTCSDGPLPPPGIGLANIRSVAEKYHGTMMTEKTGRLFSLHVLLNISLHTDGSSGQNY